MNNFYDWEGILAMKALREAVADTGSGRTLV